MEQQRSNDPFNPEYRKEKDFLRKPNRKRIIIAIILLVVIAYGLRDFIYQNTIQIELMTVTERKINTAYFIDGRCDIFIINRSPYNIKLILDESIKSNYNNEFLRPNIQYYFWFESNTTKTLSIDGVKG